MPAFDPPPKISARVSALLWADILVGYALFVMQDYLTSVWNLSITHAAGILNVFNGISMVLPVIFLFLVEAFLGNRMMLVISSITYSVGIGLVTMSTPPVLGGSCTQYKEECIGPKQKALFYAGMALIAVGSSGNRVSVEPFIEQRRDDDEPSNFLKKLLPYAFVVIVPLVGAFGLPYVKPWELQFGIPAICTAAAMIIFLCGVCVCPYYTNGEQSVGTGGGTILRTMLIGLTFVVCGIISSIGNTYFVEQATNLNRHIVKWNVPLQTFLLVSNCSKGVFGLISNKVLKRPRLGIVIAMVFSVLTCITAAKMEQKRLRAVRRHGLLDKPNADIPMSIYWLVFQYVLLGGLDSFLESNVKLLYQDKPEKVIEYLTKFVTGLGYMLGVFSVYVVGRVSERNGGRNWFQSTLNESRLDRYYWVLAGLGVVNLLVFSVVAPFYRR